MSAYRRLTARLLNPDSVRDAVLFVWFYLHLLLVVQPRLIYQAHHPIFSLAPGFFRQFRDYPGGVAQYLALLQSQFYVRDWLGALILTGEAAILYLFTRLYLGRLARGPVRFLHLLPTLLFMMVASRYDQPLATSVAVTVTLGCAVLCARVGWRCWGARMALYSALVALLYYTVSAPVVKTEILFTFALFTPLALFAELRRGYRLLPALGIAAAYLLIPAGLIALGERALFARYSLPFSAWLQTPAGATPLLVTALFGSFPLLGLWAALDAGSLPRRAWSWLRRKHSGDAAEADDAPTRRGRGKKGDARASEPPPATPPGEVAPSGDAPQAKRLDPRVLWLLEAALLLWGVSALIPYVCLDAPARRQWQMSYGAMHGEWENLLAAAGNLTPAERTPITCLDINMALLHTGRLGDDMFQYAQQPGAMMPPLMDTPSLEYSYRVADACLRVGRVNDAEHMACEGYTQTGPHPELAQVLAKIYLTKGQIPAARIFLNTLSYDLVYRSWARRYLTLLRRDPQLSSDPEVQSLRQAMLRTDDVQQVTGYDGTPDPQIAFLWEPMLLNLLKQNPKNRAAFECLMGYYLLANRPDQIAANIHRLDDFGLTRIPRAYEEALLVARDQSGKLPDLHGRTISRESQERYERFKGILARSGGDGRRAYAEMGEEDARTFFFFRTFRAGAQR